ncbi:ABC transporter permease [Sulfurimonas sp. SAG-AH-194-I05]|nr:ABC transporter permease [Sulfurimonas sp. SAG-AH-194-I05]MDF1875018.1 ABC transporter permease [Sulfurimonas sp. SAG-AH-194-I05]
MNAYKQLFKQLVDNFEHSITFVKRDIKYARVDTKLGLFWVIFPPLVPLTVFIGLAALGIIRRSADIPFVMYIVIGITLYRFMTQFITTTVNVFRTERNALKNYNVPLIVLIVSQNAMTFFHLLLRLVLVACVVLYYGVEARIDWLLLPVVFIFMVMFSFGIGTILAFKNLLYRDYSKGLNLLVLYMMFVSSVIFPFPKDGIIGFINHFNPLNTYVDFTRSLFYHGVENSNYIVLCITAFISFLLFLYACNLIYYSEKKVKMVL